MEHIRLGTTDIVFEEIANIKWKMIISDDYNGYNFSYSWSGQKENTLKKFVCSLSTDYFVDKLSHNLKGGLDIRKTFSKLRSFLRDCFENELKWYQNMEFQKDFRERLKKMQHSCTNGKDFIDTIICFHEELDYSLIEDNNERERIMEMFKNIFTDCEPWNFIENMTHPEEIFLTKLHIKLKKALNKSIQLCLF